MQIIKICRFTCIDLCIIVGSTVDANAVSGSSFLCDQISVFGVYGKKGYLDVVFRKHIQKLFGIRPWTVIECQIDDLPGWND